MFGFCCLASGAADDDAANKRRIERAQMRDLESRLQKDNLSSRSDSNRTTTTTSSFAHRRSILVEDVEGDDSVSFSTMSVVPTPRMTYSISNPLAHKFWAVWWCQLIVCKMSEQYSKMRDVKNLVGEEKFFMESPKILSPY